MRNPKPLLQVAAAVATAVTMLRPWAPAHAYTEVVLHSFSGGSDGDRPLANLMMDQNGDLFGTTYFGGGSCKKSFGCGTVFKVAPDGTETVLSAFASGRHGAFPYGGLVEDQQGDLYGTTTEWGKGGRASCCGTVFEVTPQGVQTVLHAFTGGSDGGTPYAGLIADQAGNFYGTTLGTVFEISSNHTYAVLYDFKGGEDGDDVQTPLALDAAGNLYGTTLLGGGTGCGGYGCGTVFQLPAGGTESVLYTFLGGRDGWGPSGGLTLDQAGNLYGTTFVGGGSGCGGDGCGTVFEVALDGSETVLSRFDHAGGPVSPGGGVIRDQNGNLFGTTQDGGAANCGTVFEVAPGRSAKALYSFGCGKDGAYPVAGLLMDQSGNLYGTTRGGGTGGDGVVFELKK